jgi:hypothetical protein
MDIKPLRLSLSKPRFGENRHPHNSRERIKGEGSEKKAARFGVVAQDLIEIEPLTRGAASRRLSLSPRMCEERGF